MAESYTQVYIGVLLVSLFAYVTTAGGRCGFVLENSRTECGYLGVPENECQTLGCCWDEDAKDLKHRCYQKGCAPGTFGWGCRFICSCAEGEVCDPVTGACRSGCPSNKWGKSCQLDNKCTYNDPKGQYYTGKQALSEHGHLCWDWTRQQHYPPRHFADRTFEGAKNFCRNPKPVDGRTWCYYGRSSSDKKWDFCKLDACECSLGLFGVNCTNESHCADVNEACHPINGTCSSGCHPWWTSPNCQECAPGRFGLQCSKECHCDSSQDICDKDTGFCQSGCAAGWTDLDCQTECAHGWYGIDCDYQCNCANSSEDCHKKSGECISGCREGYSGAGCLIQCRCRDPSERCDAEDGRCQSGCAPGWVGSACHLEIPALRSPPKAKSRGLNSVTLRWTKWERFKDAGEGPVTGYRVFYKHQNMTGNWRKKRVTTHEVVIDSLMENEVYVFKVAPIHRDGFEGYPGPEAIIRTCGKPTEGPQDLRIIARNHGTVAVDPWEDGDGTDAGHYYHTTHVQLEIQWKVPPQRAWGCDHLKHYRLYRRGPADNKFQFWKTTDIHKTIIAEVDVYANYSMGVTAVNSAGRESDMTVGTFVGRPSGVRDLMVGQVTPTSLLLLWDPPSHSNGRVLHYVVRYKEQRISDCEVDQSSWSGNLVVNVTTTLYNLTGLRPYSKYQYRVWAATNMGKGLPETRSDITAPLIPTQKVENVRQMLLKAAVTRFEWDAIDCENRYGITVGYQYELMEVDTGVTVVRNQINTTEVQIDDIIPFTRYQFRVKFLNHIGAAPWSDAMVFDSLEDRPLAPTDVQITESTASSLSIIWLPPSPSHGVLKAYEVQYYSKHNLGHPDLVKVPPEQLKCKMSKLHANTSYGFQVRAYTGLGYGPWSPVKYGFTEEAAPESPRSFKNVSRTMTALSFTWEPPQKANGILREYKIQCTPVSILGKFLGQERDRIGVVPASIHSCKVSDLQPGTQYVCTLKASTSKGYGASARGVYWTKPKKPVPPEAPIIDSTKSTDTSIAIIIKPTERIAFSTVSATSINQIVVERRAPQDQKSRRRREVHQPCNLTHNELLNHTLAEQQGIGCYVAADLDVVVEQIFVIGDNRTYGHYHNVPLETGHQYDVWFGVIVTVDGETSSAYSKSASPAVAAAYIVPPAPTEATMIVAGAGVAAMVSIICLIILVALLIARRKRSARRERMELIIANKAPQDGSAPVRPPRKCDRNGTNDKGVLPDVCNSSIEDLTRTDNEMEPLYGNAGPELIRKPISIENLWNFVKEKKNSKTDSLRTEYEELPMGLKAKCEIARKPENKVKNRYGNIVAYDHSRVVLESIPEDCSTDYINADYIDGYRKPRAFIATQGPSKHTLNDIWRLAWQENSRRIVMVTNLVEDGRHKCEQYWPESDPRLYGDTWVETLNQEQLADFTIRTFQLTKGNDTKTVRQFHFTAWPDHGVPTYATSLLAFRKKVRSYDDPTAGSTIVHCSAGVGRTGTFIALDCLLDQAKVEGQVDIYNFVMQMRTKRVNMIQTQEQYVFVYDALLEALKCGDTSIPCVDFRKRYAEMLSKINNETGKVRLMEEFELVQIMSPPLDTTTCRDALDPENLHKNRYTHIVPIDNLSRAYLATYIPGSTDYINAVFVDGYRQRDAFIVTQMPMPHTIMDFWTMVYDHSCKTIIMMNELDPKDETCACYWPEEGEPFEYGPFSIELKSADNTRNDLIIRDFAVTMKKKGKKDSEPHFVRQFQYLGWPRDMPIPPNKGSIITLINLIEKWQQRSGNNVITVHCLDGATQSGLFCSISYMLERLKVEQEVDVFQSTKHVRVNRPHLVPTIEQYRFLYDMAIEYMDCFDAYANFK